MNIDKKYELVLEAYNNAYAKYSNFQVGAVVITKDGKYFLGSNIENASFGLTNCAERSALFSAYSNGVRKDDIEELVTTVKVLAVREEAVENTVKEIKNDVKSIKEKPAKRWDAVVTQIITIAVATIAGFILAKLEL